ncbi:MAG: hypothetical protein E7598_02170 [Ruminococcaceae bacterium]|nr:hypothetical protein [Oscillospiraceae bacterium]
MFGYVRAQREDLTVRQDMFYRAAYCGLCKQMGKCTGQCSRLSLSYDMVFLYLVRMAILGKKAATKKGICLLHPFKKRLIVKGDEELEYAARVSALLTYGKICDDLADEKGFKRFVKKLIKPFFAKAKKRADLDTLYQLIEEKLCELSAIEAANNESVDAPAEVFGKLLSDVFAFGLEGDRETLAREIGFRTGRFIYAVDAADDIAEDKEKGTYNPFLLLYGTEIDQKQKNLIEMAMKYDLTALAAAIDLIDDGEMVRIIKNIIYLGMPNAAHKALGEKQ